MLTLGNCQKSASGGRYLGDPKATLAEFLPMLRSRLGARQQAARQRTESSVAPKRSVQRLAERAAEEAQRQPMSALVMNKVIADSVPQDIVIVDESITSGAGLREFLPRRRPGLFWPEGRWHWLGLPATMGQRWLSRPASTGGHRRWQRHV